MKNKKIKIKMNLIMKKMVLMNIMNNKMKMMMEIRMMRKKRMVIMKMKKMTKMKYQILKILIIYNKIIVIILKENIEIILLMMKVYKLHKNKENHQIFQ